MNNGTGAPVILLGVALGALGGFIYAGAVFGYGPVLMTVGGVCIAGGSIVRYLEGREK